MRTFKISSILIALVFALSACGGDEQPRERDDAAVETEDDMRTIEIIGTDDMRFVVGEAESGLVTGGSSGQNVILEAIEASPGEEIRITLTTVSNMPASAMSHNLAILEKEADTEEFAQASLQASDNEYIAPDYEDWVIVTTGMLGDGETDTIEFTAPEEEGTYDYVCTFPGHYAGGMVGELIVQ